MKVFKSSSGVTCQMKENQNVPFQQQKKIVQMSYKWGALME